MTIEFEARGYVRIPEAFPPDAALRMQDAMWRELREDFNIVREDRSTWRQPERDLRRVRSASEQDAITTPRLTGRIEALVGAANWTKPRDWGRVLVTFPEGEGRDWTLPTGPWHWDSELGRNLDGVRRLVIFTFFSDVTSHGGGTVIVEGSHRLLARFYERLSNDERKLKHGKLRKRFLNWDPWLRSLAGLEDGPPDRVGYFMDVPREVHGIPVRVVELTGRPGDAVLCHPLMIHCPAPNCSRTPRFMRIKFPATASSA